jgi:hypothetical protein
MLREILSQCRKQLKEGGFICVSDFEFVSIPQDDWWAGMYTTTKDGKTPKDFSPF